MNLKRGMLPWRPEAVKLSLRNYLNQPALPLLPERYGHVGVAQPPVKDGWDMDGNDNWGCCAMAGPAHETQVFCWASGKPIPRFGAGIIVPQYLSLTTDGKDVGLDPIDVANWRVNHGLVDADGNSHKLTAFASVGNLAEVGYSVYLFGACGIGLALPPSAEDQFRAGHIWDDISKAPTAGHYVPIVGRHGGRFYCVTWGALQGVSDAYLNKYMMGGLCFVSPDYVLASGITPEGLNTAQWLSDFSAVQQA
jgi:hypothetical protein